MVEDNVCASCKRCCVNASHIGLMTKPELETMMFEVGAYRKRNNLPEISIGYKPWKYGGVFEMTDVPCPAFIENKCCLKEDERPATCLLFPFRPDYDEETKKWELDLAVTKCPGALTFIIYIDKAIELFKQMRKDGRWKT